MSLRLCVILYSVFLVTSCTTYNSGLAQRPSQNRMLPGSTTLSDIPNEPGKCYAKCLLPESIETQKYVLGSFGLDEQVPEELLVRQQMVAAGDKWVKKKADKNCLSANPDDCLVWCLVKTEPIYDLRWVELDSSDVVTKQIVYSEYEHVIPEGSTDWREVVCGNDLNSGLIADVRAALFERGYEPGDSNKINKEFKSALLKFQTDYGFGKGQLTIESLSALGVVY